MSENQYEPKFVDDREEKPDDEALRAAERLAEEQKQRAHAPSSSAVFNPFDMTLSVSTQSYNFDDGRVLLLLRCALSLMSAAAGARGRFPQPGAAQPARPAPAAATTARPSRRPRQPGAHASRRPAGTGARRPERANRSDCLGVPLYPGRAVHRVVRRRPRPAVLPLRLDAAFVGLVTYYRTLLKQRGELVFDVPATHQFDVGRFREETMAFPPGVTIKDYRVGDLAGLSEPEDRRPAGTVSHHHPDRAGHRKVGWRSALN